MEEWETLVDRYQALESEAFENVLQTAQTLTTVDLAQFEIDYFLETLLLKPVALLETVSSRRNDDAWSKKLEKAFNLLSDVVQKFNAEPYYEDINKLCNLTYPARVAGKALECLTQLVKRYSPSPSDVQAQEDALSYNDTCKAVRVQLLGVLCEYHPELFTDVTTLWRTFLNMIDGSTSKVSLNVVKSVLEAVLGLFKNFGADLVVSELYEFYDRMVPLMSKAAYDEGRTRRRCHEVCCTILERHAALFAEKVSGDPALRGVLWETLSAGSRGAVLEVYRTCYREGSCVQTITEEALTKAESGGALVKYTALRVLSAARDVIVFDVDCRVDVPALERRLRGGASYEDVEALSWCIRANVVATERLLRAAILLYDTFPASMRKEAVLHSILEAPREIRTPAIIFLTTETCASDDAQKDKYMSVWKDLLDSNNGADLIVVENSQNVLEDYLDHAVFLLETFLEEDVEVLPDKISSLLNLTAYILNTQETSKHSVSTQLINVTARYIQAYPSAEVVRVGRAVGGLLDEGRDRFYTHTNIDSSVDEEHFLELCLAWVDAPIHTVDSRQVLLAAKILLSKTNTEPKTLSKVLEKLETMILGENGNLDQDLILEVIGLVEKRRKLHVSGSKDDRILHRDMLMFLGKFLTNEVDEVHNTENILRKDYAELYLSIPVPDEGTTLKLNLQAVLDQAIAVEDSDMLWTLITIICANSRNLTDESTCTLLCRAAAARARCGPPPGRAPPLGRATDLLPYIVKESSPRARRLLLEAFDPVLTSSSQVQISEVAASVINVADQLCKTSQAKLDLLSPIIKAMKENSLLSQKFLPGMLILVLKTQHFNTKTVFKEISEIFLQKTTLFDSNVLSKLVYDVVDSLCDENLVITKTKKVVENAVSFLKELYDLNRKQLPEVVDVFSNAARDPTPQVLGVLSAMKSVFVCDMQLYREFVAKNGVFFEKIYNFAMLQSLVMMREPGIHDSDMDKYSVWLREAILNFVATYADVLLEIYYEKTLNIISEVIVRSTPGQIQYIQKSLSVCMCALRRELKTIPQVLYMSVSKWFKSLDLSCISKMLSESSDTDCVDMIKGLKCVLEVFGVDWLADDVTRVAGEWLGYVREGRGQWHDVVAVCLMALPADGVGRIVIADDKEDVITFCNTYIPAFSEFFVKNSELFTGEWSEFSILLNDIVQYRVRRRRDDPDVIELVDKSWPSYESKSTFKQKLALLSDLSCLNTKLPAKSKPMQWLIRTMESDATMEEKTRLVALVPAGEEYSQVYRGFAARLPARVSELGAGSAYSLQAMLDHAAATGDPTLVGIVAAFADGDVTRGWWDEAFDDCMRVVASDVDMGLLRAVYTSARGGRTVGVCTRLLIPLLRYTPSSLCEEFFSTVLEELFSVLRKRPRDVTATSVYQKCVLDYTRAFDVLRIAFEKIPKSSLESPDSRLYSQTASCNRPHYLVINVCKLAAELRKTVRSPDGAGDTLKGIVRQFHCSNYNCMAAAICCKAPKPSFYLAVFDVEVWGTIVDHDVVYQLPITEEWKQHTTRQAVSIDMEGEHALLSAGTMSRTVHFLRTLSEDPFLYDIPDLGDSSQTIQELQLVDNPLNQHECAATLTALFCRAATLDDVAWRNVLCSALVDGTGNVPWLLAQIVCNCKEEMRAHATALRPALLALVSNTARDKLNRLHVEILKTIIHWREDTNEIPHSASEHFNNVIKALILTIKSYKRQNIVLNLLEKLRILSEMYAPFVRVCVEWFDAASGCVGADTKEIELKILKILSKNKVDMTVLMPKIFEIFEKSTSDLNIEVPRLLGAALATLAHPDDVVARFRSVVAGVRRSSVANYVKIVYYTQMGYPACCDTKIIREIVDLVSKIPGREKQKCLDIIALYLSGSNPGQHVNELFDALDISQLLLRGEGLNIALKGLPLMDEGLRRRVVGQLAGGRGALDVLVTALEVTLSKSVEPPSKRRATSPLLTGELRPIVSRIAAGLTGDSVARVAGCLSADTAIRFFEAFLIAVYYPMTSRGLGASASLALDLFFHRLRSQEAFKRATLRDKPLDLGETIQTNAPRASTGNLTQIGQGITVSGVPSNTEIDVQIPIDEILHKILQFAKSQRLVAEELFVQVWRRSRSPYTEVAADHLAEMLQHATTLVLSACRTFLDACSNVDGFANTVDQLRRATRGTEGYGLVETLHQEVMLRGSGPQHFVMGLCTTNADEEMVEERNTFSIKELVASFGMLSNWDDFTTEKRESISKKIPVLWTTRDTFKRSLEEYEGSVPWFDAMLSVYMDRGENYKSSRVLKNVDAWPRNSFDVAAVSESIEWQHIRCESHSEGDCFKLKANIRRGDCLAKWAARLMLRRLFLEELDVESNSEASGVERTLSLSHQLEWCTRANEMDIPKLALRCLEDVPDLYGSETLKWLQQKMLALRTIGLQRNDRGKFEEALELYESSSQFRDVSSFEDIIGVEYLRLVLLEDLNALSISQLRKICDDIHESDEFRLSELSKESRRTLDTIYVFVMVAFDKELEKSDEYNTKCDILLEMARILKSYAEMDSGSKKSILADLIIRRLSDFKRKLTSEVSAAVLEALSSTTEESDEFALELIRESQNIFDEGPRVTRAYDHLFTIDESVVRYKQMLSLVADPKHSLLQYCGGLQRALQENDKTTWTQTFKRMKAKIFENPYAGPDYQVLHQHKSALYDIEDFATPTQAKQTLSQLQRQLSGELQAGRSSVRLPQVCPTLCGRALRSEPALLGLLRLPKDATVEFDETVTIYTDSIRRVAVLSAWVGGRIVRYLVKGGEPPRVDAAAGRARAALAALSGMGDRGGYWVTPLSEDCGLIQYLEHHERVRTLILNSAETDISTVLSSVPSNENQILLSSNKSLEQFEQCCSKVPATLLRSAIERNSSGLDDFLLKKSRFVESLSGITVINWLLGVGDRHLENIMYNYMDGTLCNIDWGGALQYGAGELPCSRLTRNLLAVCDAHVLEGQLQAIVRRLRENGTLASAVLDVSFGWMEDYNNKMSYMRGLLEGTSLSYQVTKDVLRKSNVKHKEKYIELLDDVFADFDDKESYTVEEQVSCLLRQSTDPRILSVTRAKWEPWV